MRLPAAAPPRPQLSKHRLAPGASAVRGHGARRGRVAGRLAGAAIAAACGGAACAWPRSPEAGLLKLRRNVLDDSLVSVTELRSSLREEVRRLRRDVHALVVEVDRKAASAVERYHKAKTQVKGATEGYYRDDSLQSLAVVCVINCVVLAAMAAVILAVRSRAGAARLRELFAPRLAATGSGSAIVGDTVLPPPQLGLKMSTWLATVCGVSDREFLFSCGIDAFALYRIVFLGLRFCWLALPPSVLMLVLYGWEDPSGKTHYGANRVSLCNVSAGSGLLWAPVAFAYYLVSLACVMLWQEQRGFSEAYRSYLLGLCGGNHPLSRDLRTVLLEDLPERLCSESALIQELEGLLGAGCVAHVELRGCSGEEAIGRLQSGSSTPARQTTLGLAVALLRRALRGVRSVACAEVTSRSHAAPSALVTFRSHVITLQAVQLTLSDDFAASPAPFGSDIVASNVGRSRHHVAWRTAAVDAALVVGLLLWSVPVTFVQALATMRNVQLIFGIELDESTRTYAFLTQYLPVLAWLWLLRMLQGIFRCIAEHYEGVATYSEIQLRTMRRYWAYTLCTMYVTVLSGSLLDSLGNVLERPRNVIIFLGASLPQVSIYFLSVVLSKGLLTLPLTALRPEAFAAWAWRTLAARRQKPRGPAATRAELSAADEGVGGKAPHPWASTQEERFVAVNYGAELPDVLLVFTICVAFAPLAPLVVLAGAVFFGVALLTYRFGALYAWRAPFQGQARFFSFFLSQALGVLPVSVLTLLAALALNGGYMQALALVPLLGGALAFANGAPAQTRVREGVPLTVAKELDAGLEGIGL